MATTLIKDKLSKLVSGQLPEFIQNDYPTFLAFVQAYYKFLEQDQGSQELLQNIFSYNDIDRTIDSFIEYFKTNYFVGVPESNIVDEKLLIKNVKDLYANKGDEKSFLLLLKMILNKTAEFDYPGKYILIASDGRWQQEVSIFVKILAGSSDNIVGKTVDITIGETFKDSVFIKEKNPVIATIGGEDFLSTDTFEYILDNSNNVQVSIGDFLESPGFRGEIVATTTSAKILDGGTNFKVGQTFRLLSGDGTRSFIRIAEVSSIGEITRIEFIQYGIGYESDFLTTITPGTELEALSVFSINGTTLILADSTEGFVDKGTFSRYNYTLVTPDPAFNPSYCGEILRTFLTDSRIIVNSTGEAATIQINRGAKAKYPGYYLTNSGFLSDDIYIQDMDYYQPYSYVIEIDEQLKVYKKALIDILHPAGTKLFGNYIISNSKITLPKIEASVSAE